MIPLRLTNSWEFVAFSWVCIRKEHRLVWLSPGSKKLHWSLTCRKHGGGNAFTPSAARKLVCCSYCCCWVLLLVLVSASSAELELVGSLCCWSVAFSRFSAKHEQRTFTGFQTGILVYSATKSWFTTIQRYNYDAPDSRFTYIFSWHEHWLKRPPWAILSFFDSTSSNNRSSKVKLVAHNSATHKYVLAYCATGFFLVFLLSLFWQTEESFARLNAQKWLQW